MTNKKKEELGYLNSLRCFCKDLPEGEVIPGETPDFIIQAKTYRLGIEITKIYLEAGGKKNAPQSIESARDRITNLAKQIAEKRGLPPISVTLFFNHMRPLLRNEECAIARAVVQAVADGLPPPGENTDLECQYGSAQPTEVDEILINRATPVGEHEWKWTSYSRIETDGVSFIERVIAQKTNTIDAIRSKCEECWLLIVAETGRGSGNIKPDAENFTHVYRSPFDRTYFFDNGLGSLTKLRTIDPTSMAELPASRP